MNLPFVELNLPKVLITVPLLSQSLRAKHFNKFFVDLLDASPSFEDKDNDALILLLIALLGLSPICKRLIKLFFVIFASIDLSAIAHMLLSNPDHRRLARCERLLFILYNL